MRRVEEVLQREYSDCLSVHFSGSPHIHDVLGPRNEIDPGIEQPQTCDLVLESLATRYVNIASYHGNSSLANTRSRALT